MLKPINIAIILILTVLILVITYIKLYKNTDTNESFIVSPTNTASSTPGVVPTCIPQVMPWWRTSPVKSIISKYSGVGVNVSTSESPDGSTGNLNSKYLVFIQSPNPSIPKGSLSVDNSSGVFTTTTPNGSDINQLWNIVLISSDSDISELMTTPTNPNPTITNKIYPYYVIITNNSNTSGNSKRALQYENGSISVRILGDYDAQRWDISPNSIVSPGVVVVGNNQLSHFSPEYVGNGVGVGVGVSGGSSNGNNLNQMNANTTNQIMSSLNQILGYLQSTGGNTNPSSSIFGNKPLSLNVSVGGNPNRIVSTGDNTTTSIGTFGDVSTKSTVAPDVSKLLDTYTAQQLGTISSAQVRALVSQPLSEQCSTPNMSDYISKTGIPCTSCANF